MMHRRGFVFALVATGVVSGCQSTPKPSSVTINLSGQPGMNPGPGGGERPVTVLVMRLRSTGKFNSADYFALQSNAAGTLAGDLIGSDTVAVAPGQTASKTLTVEPETAAIGLVALLRDPGGRSWRTTRSVSAGSKVTLNVQLGAGGIS